MLPCFDLVAGSLPGCTVAVQSPSLVSLSATVPLEDCHGKANGRRNCSPRV
jgi:hypothetical protein